MEHSATYGAGYVAGTLFGYVLIYGGILALGVFFGKRLARRRGVLFIRWPLYVALGVMLLLLAGQCASSSRAQGVASGREA